MTMPPVYSVSQVVAMMKDCLEHRFPSVDIEAEISNWRVYPSGHSYFALKDEGSQLNAVLFARVPCDCRAKLGDGRRVKVRGRISVYPQRGECQFVVTRIKVAGEGELMAKYLALKEKLAAEGLFDSARKRPLPRLPRRIGLVTSQAGAVVHDMCRVLTRRFPNLQIRIFPAQVQGADAPPSLVAGVAYFARNADWRADLVIIARGGGSFEDLFCFNDETLVRTIAACPVPVISAVGHETDFTLCDFAADVRAGTPSIAAELAVPLLSDMKKHLGEASEALSRTLRHRGDIEGERLERASKRLVNALRNAGDNAAQHMDRLSERLSLALKNGGSAAAQQMARFAERLDSAVKLAYERQVSALEKAAARLKLLSPYAVLERGYSLTTDSSGAVVTDASQLASGDAITTRFSRGSVQSTVSAIADEA
ncbi:MAG: exodeoxyribonuclease VII large subunit [Kiritimatiellae bacterium]|nr:exodeoxyribonuclease VII large subunit [Kiritimatiellia bacterium]